MNELKIDQKIYKNHLILIWVGFLGVCFKVGRSGGKITSLFLSKVC